MEHIQQSFAITIKDPRLSEILERLANAEQLSVSLLDDLATSHAQALSKVAQLKQDFASFPEFPQKIQDLFDKNLCHHQLLNVGATLNQLEQSLQQANLEQAMLLAKFHMVPFIHVLKETCYFWGNVYPDPNLMAQYYADEFVAHYTPFKYSATKPYQISIVITAYNHVDVTKQCIQSLFQYTDLKSLNAELVLVDDGSSDETFEYLKTVPNAKVIHVPYNARCNTFATIPWFCEGQYILLSNNDILFTQNWLSNLLTCVKSDPKIAVAVPMTPETDNHQFPVKKKLPKDEFIAWANEFNYSDPNKWIERTRILPTVALYNTQALEQIGFCDPIFYSLLFWDDDFSLRARRNGYRQIQCEDTACFHFGSVTINAIDPRTLSPKDNPNVFGRKVYYKKHYLDAWRYDQSYDSTAIRILDSLIQSSLNQPSIQQSTQNSLPNDAQGNVQGSVQGNAQSDLHSDSLKPSSPLKCLSIDGGYGDTMLQLKNRHKELTLYSVTSKEQYAPELRQISDHFEYHSCPIPLAVHRCFENETFDLIHIGWEVSNYSIGIEELLAAIYTRLKPEGKVLLRINNPWFAKSMERLLNFNLPQHTCTWLDPKYVQLAAQNVFKFTHVIQAKAPFANLEEFAQKKFADNIYPQESIRSSLEIMAYYMICGKQLPNANQSEQVPTNNPSA